MKKLLKCSCSEKWGGIAPLVLRIVVGSIFLFHGYQKWTGGVEQFEGFIASLGIPIPALFAFLVVALEIFGGIALILGVFTHWISKLFAIEMLFALTFVHLKNGFLVSNGGYEFVLLLFASAITLMITGAGKHSIDAKHKKS